MVEVGYNEEYNESVWEKSDMESFASLMKSICIVPVVKR